MGTQEWNPSAKTQIIYLYSRNRMEVQRKGFSNLIYLNISRRTKSLFG